MDYQFEMLRQTRKNLLGLVEPFNTEQLNFVPQGLKNNMAWNLGHVIVSQQNLCYKLSGLPLNIPEIYLEQFGRGTAPIAPWSQKEIDQLKDLARSTVEILVEDYHQGIFEQFHGYQSQYGVKINTIEEAIVFNNVHEGLHLGYLMAMRKLMV